MTMRITILTPYYLPIVGGIASYVSGLVTTLSMNKDIEVDIITRFGKKGDNIQVINANKLFFILIAYLHLFLRKCDVVHSHANWYVLAPCVIYKMFNHKITLIHTFHTDPVNEIKGFKKMMFEWLLSKCDVVTFVSSFLMKKGEKNLKIATKEKVIYAGVSEHSVNKEEIEEFKEKYGLKGSSPVLSFVGPLVWKKKVEGVKMLIRAFKKVIGEYSNAKLLIIGDGEYMEDIEMFVKELDIENNVVFTGFLDDVFVPLSVTDIYTHISLQEGGVSISLLEAMSIGKPVIATKIGGIPELIIDGENGILVDPEPKAIAKKIIELYEDEEICKRIGNTALSTVKNNFSWQKIAGDFIDVYYRGRK
ncbi:hypothetical protein DRO38_08050 [Candidatus Bathyarchaeota archaeon]|nr:MAG: hypothetical protein DRO38_08050 [Candidatus Bathyarchaeota archaeon]